MENNRDFSKSLAMGQENSPPILIVDDDEYILKSLSLFLRSAGFAQIVTVSEGKEVLPALLTRRPAAILLDLYMPQISGVELLAEIIRHFPEIPVLVVTANQDVQIAVDCMREGAFDYLVKPVDKDRLLGSLRRAMELFLLKREVHNLKDYLIHGGLQHEHAFDKILTASQHMRGIFQYIEAIASSPETILVMGETGVGKGLLAEAIHRVSGRMGDFISLNVAGLDDNLFSDTLFGHRKGAFSGAESARDGLVAAAGQGTLFLDEVGDLNLPSQIKLLRLLQERTYYPLGSDVPKLSNARVITATNHDLRQLIGQGRFRSDLYYRLSSHKVIIPPLRERKEDIPILLSYFLQEAATAMSRVIPEIPSELLTLLAAYHFPGNVRELRAMVFDAMARHKIGFTLSMDSFHRTLRENSRNMHLPENEQREETTVVTGNKPLSIQGAFPSLQDGVDFLIEEAMKRANQNQGIAASLLGISRQSLNRRLVNKKRRPPL